METKAVAGFLGLTVFLVIVIFYYNRLVRLRLAARQSWSDIDVHLKKRYELVPNLVEVVKGYAGHENQTLVKVLSQRSVAMKAATPGEKGRAEGLLLQSLRGLLTVVEAYPDLKANAHFSDLMKQMRQLEDNIEYARRFYNAAARDYNVATEVFPSNIVASSFLFTLQEFFELDEPGAERKQVAVKFE